MSTQKPTKSKKTTRPTKPTPKKTKIVHKAATQGAVLRDFGLPVKVKPQMSNHLIPSNEGGKTDASHAYALCLSNPKDNVARIPDAYPVATSVFRSVNAFNVPIRFGTTTDSGRFSFAVRPTFGATANPAQYQAAVVNAPAIGDTPWSTVDFSRNIAYLSSTGEFGRDPRLDINAPALLSNAASFFGATYAGVSPTLTPKILWTADLSATTLSGLNSGVPPTTFSPFNQADATGASYSIPYGQWTVALQTTFSLASGVAGNVAYLAPQAVSVPVAIRASDQSKCVCPATGVDYTVASTFQVVSTPGANRFSACLSNTTGPGAQTPLGDAVATVTRTTVTISPVFLGQSVPYNSCGVIQESRPVAMAVLATYIGPELTNGGEIAINYVSNKILSANYFSTTAGGLGQLQYYENLRSTEGAFDGKLKDGAWQSWAPYSGEDLELLSPETMATHPYPGIVCSGVWTPGTTTPGPTTGALRVEVYIVYEFRTEYTMFKQVSLHGSQAEVDAALRLLRTSKLNSENSSHVKRLKKYAAGLANFYRNNSSWINPTALGLAALL